MIYLNVADLVVIASRILGVRTTETLGMLDIAAAETALADAARSGPAQADAARGGPAQAEAALDRTARAAAAGGAGRGGDSRDDVATPAAGLLHTLLRHRLFPRSNEQIALVAAVQFLAMNGWQADLDPAEAKAVIEETAAGGMAAAELAYWLSPRLSRDPRPQSSPPVRETRMRGWLPGRIRGSRTKGLTCQRYTDGARQVISRPRKRRAGSATATSGPSTSCSA